jgi:hypothetical protein
LLLSAPGKKMPSPPALRAAKALAASGKPKQGQTTEDLWARIIDRETGVADLLVACEAALEYMRFTGDKDLVEKLTAAIAKAKRKTI